MYRQVHHSNSPPLRQVFELGGDAIPLKMAHNLTLCIVYELGHVQRISSRVGSCRCARSSSWAATLYP